MKYLYTTQLITSGYQMAYAVIVHDILILQCYFYLDQLAVTPKRNGVLYIVRYSMNDV